MSQYVSKKRSNIKSGGFFDTKPSDEGVKSLGGFFDVEKPKSGFFDVPKPKEKQKQNGFFDISRKDKGPKVSGFFDVSQKSKGGGFFDIKTKEKSKEPIQKSTEQVLDDITEIISNPDMTKSQKAASMLNYLTSGKELTSQTYDYCTRWLMANKRTICFGCAFGSLILLGPVLATSLYSGSLASLLSTMISLGWGSVPILMSGGGMFAKALADSGIKSIGGVAITQLSTITVSGIFYGLKKTEAGKKVLERKVDNKAVKAVFKRLGADVDNLKYETLSKEAASLVASGIVSMYILGTSLPVFGVITAVGLGIRLVTGGGKGVVTGTREVRGGERKAIISELKTPLAKPELKTPLAKPELKTPLAKPELKTPSIKTPLAKTELKTPLAKPELKTPSIKTPLAKPKLKTPSIKTPLAKPKLKTPKKEVDVEKLNEKLKIAKANAVEMAKEVVKAAQKVQETAISSVVNEETTNIIETVVGSIQSEVKPKDVVEEIHELTEIRENREVIEDIPEIISGTSSTKMRLGYAIGAAATITAVAFATGDVSGMSELLGEYLSTTATQTLSGLTSLAGSTQAKTILLDLIFKKVGVDKFINGMLVGENKDKALSFAEEIKNAKDQTKIQELKHKFLSLVMKGTKYYSLVEMEKMSLIDINDILKNYGSKRFGSKQQAMAALLKLQKENYNNFVKQIAGGLSSILVSALAAGTVAGTEAAYQTFRSQEFQELLKVKEVLKNIPTETKDLGPRSSLQDLLKPPQSGLAETLEQRTMRFQELNIQKNLEQAAKEATSREMQKALQKEARKLEEIAKQAQNLKDTIKLAEEQIAHQMAFKAKLEELIKSGKVDPVTLQAAGTILESVEFKVPEAFKNILMKEFGDIEFTPLMDTVGTASAASIMTQGVQSMVNWIPGLGWGIQAYSTAVETGQNIQLAGDIGEKIKQLVDRGVADVASTGFESTISGNFAGVQNLPTLSSATTYIETLLGASSSRAKVFEALSGILDNMAASGELHQNNPELMNNLYARLTNVMIYGGDINTGVLAGTGSVVVGAGSVAVDVGKILYQGISAGLGIFG